jgi:hypothetical protein
MDKLDAPCRRLLAVLVAAIANAEPGRPETYVSYKDVYQALGLTERGRFGKILQRHGLKSLAQWTHFHRKPAITGLIIDKAKKRPGQGFFRLYGRSHEDADFPIWWMSEIAAAKAYDWSPDLVDASALSANQETE